MESEVSLVPSDLERQLFLTNEPEPFLTKYSLQELSQLLLVKLPDVLEDIGLSQEPEGELVKSTEELVSKKEPYSLVPIIKRKGQPKVVETRNFSPELLAEHRKEVINDYMDRLWKKYRRIDLVKWDLLSTDPFFDYFGQRFVSFDYVQMNIANYPSLSVERLVMELEEFQADPRNGWSLTGKEENYSKFSRLLDTCKSLL